MIRSYIGHHRHIGFQHLLRNALIFRPHRHALRNQHLCIHASRLSNRPRLLLDIRLPSPDNICLCTVRINDLRERAGCFRHRTDISSSQSRLNQSADRRFPACSIHLNNMIQPSAGSLRRHFFSYQPRAQCRDRDEKSLPCFSFSPKRKDMYSAC